MALLSRAAAFLAPFLAACAGDGAHDGVVTGTSAICAAPAGMSAARSISETVVLLNAMPKPVTLPCFLETLPRPLDVHATMSVFSAQPASGRRSPRLFLFVDPLILSVVPDGTGSNLLEFGELRSETRSLKAEIEFPVLGELRSEEPFERVVFNERGTSCSFCHQQEEPAGVTGADGFVSQALRPRSEDRVPLTELRAEFVACDAALEPERCALLKSLFAERDVVERDFPATMSTFF